MLAHFRSALLALVLGLVAVPAAAQSGQDFTIPGADVVGYAAGPVEASAAVLVVHDWFGLSDATRAVVDDLGQRGYRAFAVDLYHGKSATTHPEANTLMNSLQPERMAADLEAAVRYLSEGDRPVASVGFSMGGAPAMNAAYLVPGAVKAVANVYGGGSENVVARHEGQLPAPFLFVTGSDDVWPMDGLRTLLGEAGSDPGALEVHVFPGARHGYAQPLYAAGANLDADATAATWTVLHAFLARHLGHPIT